MKVSWKLLSLLLCGSVITGCGDTTSTAPATTGTGVSTSPGAGPAAAPAITPAVDTPATTVNADPILVGLLEEFEDLPTDFAEIKAAYAKAPTDPGAVRDYVGTIEDLGMMHAQRGNTESADLAFSRASQTLTAALSAGVSMEAAEATQLPAIVYYNHACVLGKQKKGAESMAILQKAIDNGFGNLEQIKADEDLTAVRELPQYETTLVVWEAKFAEQLKQHKEELAKHAKEQLAKGESFAFDFDLVDVDGKPISKASLADRVSIIDIWGTWCPPCRQEIPHFVKLQDKYGKYGFQMVGLNQERGQSDEDNVKIVKEFAANNSMNYPCAMITDEVLKQLPEFTGFPTTIFVDHKGQVRMKVVGFHEYEFMEAAVETLLREQAAERRANTN